MKEIKREEKSLKNNLNKKKRFKKKKKQNQLSKSCCFVSSFPPRECGIATFTRDVSNAMNKRFNPRLKSKILALEEEGEFYNYDNKVIFRLEKDDIESYIKIAKKINQSKEIKLVNIQHEFGLFGGEYGGYIVPFLNNLQKPVVVTFHTVLPKPDRLRKKIVRFIGKKSAGIIVMCNKAAKILTYHYGIHRKKIHIIYHGIPAVKFQDNLSSKKRLKLEGKTILTTFGLLSKGKGIEYVIKSLPPLIKKYPNLLYLIIGETHPVVREEEGESYRKELRKIILNLGLKNHVRFYNKYLSNQEIIEHILASDIYLSTNLEKAQISSGTLSYALGCGRVVISTPIVYAKEVLADERGIILEDTKNPELFTKAIDNILSDKELRKKIERNAYSFSRQMIWSNVASRYLEIFNKAVKLRDETTEKYPKIKLHHLKRLTNHVGIIQFSNHSTPDINSGYTIDDNSRALITTIQHSKLFNPKETEKMTQTYLNFIKKAQTKEGRFNNFLSKEEITHPKHELMNKSEDAFGRTIWALNYTIKYAKNQEFKKIAKEIYDKSEKIIEELNFPRSKAYTLFGLYYNYKFYADPKTLERIKKIADYLVGLYEKTHEKEWDWFEQKLTYANSRLSEALFLAYELTKKEKYLNIAKKTLNFLSKLLFINNKLYLIGQDGWCNRKGERSLFDQQPIDAGSMTQTYLTAYRITNDIEYYKKAVLSFNWFLGKNHLKQMMYDEKTTGCYDGLSTNSINLNQGSESITTYLMARLSMEELKRTKKNPNCF